MNVESHRILIPVLMGPTGSGKTGLATRLDPDRFEVVSCDSRQVYREMEIGTAYPTPEELAAIRHHCVGFRTPDQTMDASLYVEEATRALEDILGRGKIPLLLGGTGFYYMALKTGLFTVPPDPALRARLSSLPPGEKREELRRLDPEALQPDSGEFLPGRIHPNDAYRIQRALEIILSTGESWSSHWKRSKERWSSEGGRYRFQGFRLEVDPVDYRERVTLRARRMIEAGFVEEAVRIRHTYGDCPGLRTIGYSFALDVADGKRDGATLLELLARAHYQYGKKQITWFKREAELRAANPEEILKELSALI